MFRILPSFKTDAILVLTERYSADPRLDKRYLGIGVYKDVFGNTPVVQAVWLVFPITTSMSLPQSS